MKNTINPPINLQQVTVRLLEEAPDRQPARDLLDAHHYLKDVKAVGEQLWYGVFDNDQRWLGVLVFAAASLRLRARDQWIGWSEEQRRRRLPLVVNNCRFLLLPHKTVPNLASRTLRLALDRLSDDWHKRYAHPVLLVETFVDPERYDGTIYTASGWKELGKTDGFGRVQRDFYTQHGKPKRLFAKELHAHSRRSLSAEKLKPTLAKVEAKTPARPTQSPQTIRTIIGHFKDLPDYRSRIGHYPLWSLLSIVFLAHLCGAPRGQKDLEKFAAGLNDAQRRALGIRPSANRSSPNRHYPTPTQPTFCRLMARIDTEKLETTILQIQRQIRGEPDPTELINIDGKEPKHGNGNAIVTAVTAQSQYYLGSAIVPTDKTNEIPIARALFDKLDLDKRTVSLDALHTQAQTARELVINHGADYLLTVKDNQPTLRKTIQALIDAPPIPSFFFADDPTPNTKKKTATSPCHYYQPSPTQATSHQRNKGRKEIRTIITTSITPEQLGFPLAAQAARLTRHTHGKKPETVELLTSHPKDNFDALDWLKNNRASWGIESGLHQRLDVSHLDDLCRVRTPNSMHFMGMFRRLSNSLCIHWISQQPRPQHKTTTDFFKTMNSHHHRYPLRALSASNPSFSIPS